MEINVKGIKELRQKIRNSEDIDEVKILADMFLTEIEKDIITKLTSLNNLDKAIELIERRQNLLSEIEERRAKGSPVEELWKELNKME